MSASRRPLPALAVCLLALGLTGCGEPMTASGDQPTTPIATETAPAAPTTPAAPTPSAAPTATGDSGEARPDDPTGTAGQEAIRVRIGHDDFGVLDWTVNCSGLDSAPTVRATAEDDQGNSYMAMLFGGATGELTSFSFTWGPKGGGHTSKSGLSVTPAMGQGVGTFLVDGRTITSSGRGVSYGPFDRDLSVDTDYSVLFVCPADD